MSIEVKLPQLGDGIDTGDVLEVLVSEGDVIDVDQGILELETEKATATVPSPAAGKILKIHVSEGQSIPVGTLLLTLEPVAAAAAETPQSGAPAAQPPPPPDEPPAKPAARQPQPADAEERPPAFKTPASRSASPPPPVEEEADEPAASTATVDPAETPAGPAMRRFAREVGVDLRLVSGSGPGGRITRGDILQVVRSNGPARKNADDGQSDHYGPVRVERITKIRRTIAEKMYLSWSTVPRVTNFDDADVTDLETIRKASKSDYAARGIKLTSMPFVVKACAMALRSHPIINASIDLQAGEIIYKEYINIGVAVDTERGLIVPSMRGAQAMSIPEIAKALNEIIERVRSNQFSLDELRGGTFTISNLGAIGGTYSTPIINVPETAILLVGRSRFLPVVKDDKIVPRLMMPLSISYDHRLIDGAAAARFLNDVIGYLEAPSRLLLAP